MDTKIQVLLTFTLLKSDISCFGNSVEPDQLASEKPADQDPYCLNSTCKYMQITEILLVKLDKKNGE